MKPESADAIREIRLQIEQLMGRLTTLEAAEAPAPAAASAPAAPPEPEGISEELVLVLSAAIAAFLGKKPHIRQIRLIRSPAWAQQGRVTIQASHMIALNRG
jgi:methylmalonyl-CoA carboxyltransferase 12S subunit